MPTPTPVSAVRMTGAGRTALPLLVLGPSLGTSAAALWTACATAGLTEVFDVVAWDLPGHGHNRSVPEEPFTIADLARGVLAVVDDVLEQRGERGAPFAYAGDSVGGAVGLQLLVDAPTRVSSAVLLCTGAKIGGPTTWTDRLAQLEDAGTAGLVAGSVERWFAPGFADREPEVAAALGRALSAAADAGYAGVCRALAAFDLRPRLGEVTVPVLAVAGREDTVTPPASLRELAAGVPDGRLVELEGVAHLAPAEAPAEVAGLIRRHVLGEEADRVSEGVAAFTREAQELAAADVAWERPGLDPRSRLLVALTALAVDGRLEELARVADEAAARGITATEVRELLLQTAALSGGPAAAAAAYRVVEETWPVRK